MLVVIEGFAVCARWRPKAEDRLLITCVIMVGWGKLGGGDDEPESAVDLDATVR